MTSAHPPLDGRIFWKEALSLASRGYRLTQFAPEDEDAVSVHRDSGISFYSLGSARGRLARIYRVPRLAFALWRRRNEIDVVHVHDPELLFLLPLVRLYSRDVRFVYDVHEDYPAVLMVRPWIPLRFRSAASSAARRIEAFLGSRANLIVGATAHLGSKFPLPAGRTALVRNFPIAAEYRIPSPAPRASGARSGSPLRCTVVGGLTEIRGVRSVVEAFALLDPSRFQLELVGRFDSTGFADEVLAIAPDNVRWSGSIPFPQVPAYLATQDVGLACLHYSTNHAAALPTKVFEYLHAGLAVVASDFSEWAAFVDGCGVQVDPENPRAIADALLWLDDNRDQLEMMRAKALSRSSAEFAWEAEAQVLADAYERMLA